MRRLELTRRRFGRWRVIRLSPKRSWGRARWICRCSCGKVRSVSGGALTSGASRSCGCYAREVIGDQKRTHGMSRGTCEYRAWIAMKQRCSNRRLVCWKNYGGRGIKVCKRWRRSFVAFFSDMGKRPTGRSLDRRNNDGNYSPGNCRWATVATQNRNQRRCKP